MSAVEYERKRIAYIRGILNPFANKRNCGGRKGKRVTDGKQEWKSAQAAADAMSTEDKIVTRDHIRRWCRQKQNGWRFL